MNKSNQVTSAEPYNTNVMIYPGVYVPLTKGSPTQSKEINILKNKSVLAAADITDHIDSYVIRLVMPGLNREDFRVHDNENILSVCVMRKSGSRQSSNDMPESGITDAYYDSQIILPEDADAAFISAEYIADTLEFHVSKNSQPVKNYHASIVVY